MEENKTTELNKPSYEQLEKYALNLQQALLQAETKLRDINLTSMRLNYLFNVLDRADFFSAGFTGSCASEIEQLLSIKKKTVKENDNFVSPKE